MMSLDSKGSQKSAPNEEPSKEQPGAQRASKQKLSYRTPKGQFVHELQYLTKRAAESENVEVVAEEAALWCMTQLPPKDLFRLVSEAIKIRKRIESMPSSSSKNTICPEHDVLNCQCQSIARCGEDKPVDETKDRAEAVMTLHQVVRNREMEGSSSPNELAMESYKALLEVFPDANFVKANEKAHAKDGPEYAISDPDPTQSESAVLLVDDQNSILTQYRRLLFHTGWPIYTARNGIEALNLMKLRMFEVVFMDLQMPKMSGTECVSKFRKWESINRNSRQRIVALTEEEGLFLEKRANELHEIGFDDLENKAMSREDLVRLSHCDSNSSGGHRRSAA